MTNDKDKRFADSGWGIKPDDQPANTREAGDVDRAFRYDPAMDQPIKTILRAQRQRFNTANRVVVEPGRTTIYDLNKDAFVVEGLSYGDENLIELLKAIGAAFNPQAVRDLPADYDGTREYPLSKVWAWGAERTG